MSKIQDNKQRQYMALAPLLSLAGIFINPLASTLAPLILFFIFRTKRANVAKMALRTADLAFSIQLWIILISLVLMLGVSLNIITTNETQQMMAMATSIILLVFIGSLLFAAYKAFNGIICKHLLSFKIAERVFGLVDKRSSNEDEK